MKQPATVSMSVRVFCLTGDWAVVIPMVAIPADVDGCYYIRNTTIRQERCPICGGYTDALVHVA